MSSPEAGRCAARQLQNSFARESSGSSALARVAERFALPRVERQAEVVSEGYERVEKGLVHNPAFWVGASVPCRPKAAICGVL